MESKYVFIYVASYVLLMTIIFMIIYYSGAIGKSIVSINSLLILLPLLGLGIGGFFVLREYHFIQE